MLHGTDVKKNMCVVCVCVCGLWVCVVCVGVVCVCVCVCGVWVFCVCGVCVCVCGVCMGVWCVCVYIYMRERQRICSSTNWLMCSKHDCLFVCLSVMQLTCPTFI